MPPKGSLKPYDPYRPGLWFGLFVVVTLCIGFAAMRGTPEWLMPYVTWMGPVIIIGTGAIWICHQFRRRAWFKYVVPFYVVALLLALFASVTH